MYPSANGRTDEISQRDLRRLFGFSDHPADDDDAARYFTPPTLGGRLVFSASDLVDSHGFLDSRDMARRCDLVPAGVQVELHIGKTRHVFGDFREVAHALALAGAVVVVGEVSSGVTAVYAALRSAYGSVSA